MGEVRQDWLDIKTFFKVIKTVVTGKGVYRDERETEEKPNEML